MADVTNKTVKIYIDNSAAEFALVSLQSKADLFSSKIKKASEDQQQLLNKIKESEAAGKDISKLQTQYSELGNKINAATKGLQENAAAQKKLQDQIDSGVRPSLAQMERQVVSLRNQLRNMSEDAPGYAAKFESFKKAETQLNSMKEAFNGVAKAQKSWMDEAKTIAFGVVIGNTVEKAIESITGYLSGIVTGNAKMSDSISQLKIYMHSTTEEAQKLYSSLKKIDTRTGNSELLDIATLVAKKGIAKEQIAGVTQALDQLFVVLGKEVGDPHEAVASLVKLVNVYSEDHHVTAENIGNIGAAIAKLTSSGVATGSFLINFAERMAGVRGITGITIQSVLGMGAALEELGQKSESASTAAQKLIIQMFLKPQLYAKASGIELTKFTQMLAKDPVEALIQVAGQLKKTSKAPQELIDAFKEMDISGARVYGVLGDIAGNADYMRKRLNDSSKAFGDTGFLMDAFKEKNTNLAAEVEKLGKVFNSLINSSSISDFFKTVVGALLGFVNILKATPKWLNENSTAIRFLILGIALMNAQYIKAAFVIIAETTAKIANALVTRGIALANNIAIASQAAYIVITNLLTGSINAATAATRLWTIAINIGLGPLGLLIIAAGAAVIAFEAFANSTNRLTTNQRINQEIQQKVAEATSAQIEQTKMLTEVIESSNTSLDNKQKALQALINQNPEVLKGLTLQNIANKEGKDILDNYIKNLQLKAELEAKSALLADKLKDKASAIATIKSSNPKNAYLDDSQIENMALNTSKKSEDHWDIDFAMNGTQKLAGSTDMSGVDLVKLAQTIKEIKILQADLSTAAKKNVEDVVGKVKTETQQSEGLIAALKAKIEDLEKALPGLTTKKAIRENLSLTKEYQKQLDELLGKTTKNKEDEILKELEAFKQKLLGIGKQAEEREIDQINFQYAQLAKKAAGHAKELIEIQALKSKAIAFLLEEEEKKRQEAIDKESTAAYKSMIGSAGNTSEEHKLAKEKEYSDGIIDKKQYEAAIRAIDMETLKIQMGIAMILSHTSKEAAADVLKYKKQLEQEEVKDAIKNREELDAANKAADALRAETDKNIMKLRLELVEKGSDEELALKKEALQKEYQLEYDALLKKKKEHPELSQRINNEIDLLGDKFDSDNANLDDAHSKAKVKQELQTASEVISIAQTVSNAISKIEDAQFNKWLKQQQREKTVIEQNAKNKVITGVEAQRQLTAMQLEEDKKKAELDRKQFERNKAFSFAQTVIKGAEAVVADLKDPWKIALDIATTVAELAVISASTPKYARGGALTGPSHSQGGMPVINPRTGRKEAEVEGGEYILSKHTVNNNRAIADALLHSSMNNNGAAIKLPWQTRPYRALDINGIVTAATNMKFASGGVFPSLNNTPTNNNLLPHQQIVNQVVVQHDEETKGILASIAYRLDNPIPAKVEIPLTKIDDAYTARARIIANASAT